MNRLKTVGVVVLVVLGLPIILAWAAAYFLWVLIWGVVLRLWFWLRHARQGRRVLFVYSESPNWQTHIEENILPDIRDLSVVLNWSERRLWPATSPWEAHFFYRFAGSRDFNPIAIVFCAYGRIKTVRFHRPFLDFKHGRESALRAAEADLIEIVNAAA